MSDIMDQESIQEEDSRNTRRDQLITFTKRQAKKELTGQTETPSGTGEGTYAENYLQRQDKRTLLMVRIPLYINNITLEQEIKKHHIMNL